MIRLLCLVLIFSACALSSPYASNVRDVSKSGVTAWLLQDKALPLISVRLTFKQAGSAYDVKGKAGQAFLTSALMQEGSGGYDASAFYEELDFYAIKMNASAGLDTFTVSMDMLSEHKDKAFELLGGMLANAHYDEDDWKRIQSEHINDLKRLSERPSYIASNTFYSRAFGEDHAYAHSVYGDEESVAAIRPKDLKQFSRDHLAKDMLVMSVSGDIDATTLETLIEEHLSALPQSAAIAQKPEAATLQPQEDTIKITHSVPQSSVSIAMQGIPRDHPDFYAAYMMNHILGGSGLSARLGTALRQERGLTYSVGSSLSMMDYANWLSISFATKQETADEALDVALAQIRKAQKSGFTQPELDDAISNVTGSFPLNTDSNAERASYLSAMQLYGLGKDYFEKRNDIMKSVTLDQVNKVAHTLLDADNTLNIIVGNH